MKKLLVIISILLMSVKTKSQNSVAYAYDNNGNRTQRYFVGLSFRPAAPHGDSAKVTEENRKVAMEHGLSVYPNPTREAVSVSINKSSKTESEGATIFLMDNSGKTLDKKQYSGDAEYSFDMSKLPPGNYYIKVLFSEKETLYYKVVKVN